MSKFYEHKRSLTLEQVIDEELIVCNIGTYESFKTPYDAVKALLDYERNLAIYFERERANEQT